MNKINRGELESLVNFSAQERLVYEAISQALVDPWQRLRFLGRYASWNGLFGSCVAALAGKIGRARRLFLDPDEPVHALADRSVYVASFFFDAARDEFDDHESVHRDTHRCLAQALLKGVAHLDSKQLPALSDPSTVNTLLTEPDWLLQLNQKVVRGYGAHSEDDLPAIFHAIGYHLGSTLLAEREFSLIDEALSRIAPDLVYHLRAVHVAITGQDHIAYHWIAVHSGRGGAVETDHFEWATQGARLALRFTPEAEHPALKRALIHGFMAFAQDHRHFFEQVNQA